MSRTIVDVHILQTVPPSNLNRDDTGSPKTAVYGGVRRARVSSQAWKRAVRLAFKDLLPAEDLGERTKQVGEAIAELIAKQAPDLADQAPALAAAALKAAGIVIKEPKGGGGAESGYLLFLSRRQQENLAQAAVDAARSGSALDAKLAKAIANRDHSIDIAMFGRMVADATDINVDAAVQVAHAISVHAADTEFDYFTAVDDRKHDRQETGAGMIGTVEFNSSTLYRYATIDVDRLQETLGNVEVTRKAVEAFVTAFATSMPTGKQNTFANRTLPDAVMVRLRQTQPVNLVGAFENPVRADLASGRVQRAAEELVKYTNEVEQAYGQAPVDAWVTHVGEQTQALVALGKAVTFPELVAAVGSQVAVRLGEPA
jgi:CRISPR system Cascade subunit CasC